MGCVVLSRIDAAVSTSVAVPIGRLMLALALSCAGAESKTDRLMTRGRCGSGESAGASSAGTSLMRRGPSRRRAVRIGIAEPTILAPSDFARDEISPLLNVVIVLAVDPKLTTLDTLTIAVPALPDRHVEKRPLAKSYRPVSRIVPPFATDALVPEFVNAPIITLVEPQCGHVS